MVIETIHQIGSMEPIEETVRYYFSSNWDPFQTNSITPVFLSPHGKDSQTADLVNEISQADINASKAKGLILFQTSENAVTPKGSSVNNQVKAKLTTVLITMYARTKYESLLFAEHMNDIIQDNMPKTSFRIKKSDGIQDSAIASFEGKPITFSVPQLIDKKGFVHISTGFLICRWSKVKIS